MKYNCLDGEMNGLIEFDAALAMTPVKDNPIDRDNFYPANGDEYDLDGEEGNSFDYASGDPYAKFEDLPSFSNASGIFNKKERARRRARREKRRDLRQQRRTATALSKAEERKGRAELSKNLGKESQSDVELAKALSQNQDNKKKLSTGAKVGIGIGIVAILGVGAYFLLKKKK